MLFIFEESDQGLLVRVFGLSGGVGICTTLPKINLRQTVVLSPEKMSSD